MKPTANVPEITPRCIYKGNPVYTKKDAQVLLGICESTLEDYVASGKLRARSVGLGRFSVVFYEKDLDAFLERRTK